MRVTNSIVADNTAGTNENISGILELNTFNLIDGNPLLGPLTDNGGPTQTHALLPGRPAIGIGNNLVTEMIDQRGFVRNISGVDIGAVEAQIAPSADFDADNDVDGADFLAWQRGLGTTNASCADGNSDDDTRYRCQ